MTLSTQREAQIDRLRAIAAAALVAQSFTIYVVVLRAAAPPSEAAWAHADPILRIASRAVSLWLVPLLGVAAAAVWWRVAEPRARELRRALRDALLGVLAAAAAVGALRLLAGPALPSFIPAEESAGPGYLLSMSAGYGEEILFRLLLLPLLYVVLSRRLTRPAAIAVSALVTGLAFALLHEAGPGAFDAHYFATRFLVPGVAMSVVFLAISPTFLLTAHCAAHVLIPALFAAR